MNRTAISCKQPRRRTASQVVRSGARLSALTLGLFGSMLLAGADGGCVITITPIEEEEECQSLDEVCPNLQCDVFATNDDGCAICECEPPPPPEGCQSDADCRDDEYCAFFYDVQPLPAPEPNDPGDPDEPNDTEPSGEPPSDDGDDNAGLIAPDEPMYGQCLPLPQCDEYPAIEPVCPDGFVVEWYWDDLGCPWFECVPTDARCDSDGDCPDGFACETYEVCEGCVEPTNGGGNDSDPDNGDAAPMPPCDYEYCWTEGFCVEEPGLTCANVLCEQGTECIETSDGPQCVPTNDGCLSDEDCGEGQHCEIDYVCPDCAQDEPACLAPCFAEGRCVDDEPWYGCEVVDCAPGYICEETSNGEAVCVPVDECGDGTPALCDMIPPVCEPGQIAAVRDYCYVCVDADTCEEPPPPNEGCYSDDECGDDQRCNANEVCLPPPGCDPSDPNLGCPAVCYGFCEALDGTTGNGGVDGDHP
jgi:hypothetical protein